MKMKTGDVKDINQKQKRIKRSHEDIVIFSLLLVICFLYIGKIFIDQWYIPLNIQYENIQKEVVDQKRDNMELKQEILQAESFSYIQAWAYENGFVSQTKFYVLKGGGK